MKSPKPRLPPVVPKPRASPVQASTKPSGIPPPDTFFKRRTLVYTGAVTVIVIAGSILGAQLKSRTQAQERQAALQAQHVDGSTAEKTAPVVESPSAAPTLDTKPAPQIQPGDVQKQIVFMEERRARLLTQKMSLEKKIDNVREKMKREQDLAASRDASSEVER